MNAPRQGMVNRLHRPRTVVGISIRGCASTRALLGHCLLLAMTVSATGQEVTFDVQPRLLNLGETAQATLTFHGSRTAPSVEFPSIPGLQITGTGQQMQFGTGGNRVALTYNLFPQRPGTHVIGPYTLQFDGREIQIPEVRLEVRAPDGNASPGDMIFARIQLPDKPPYVHQVFNLELKIYSLPTVELTRDINLLGGFPETGIVLSGFEERQVAREEVNGQFYNVRRFQARARAVSAGTHVFQPILRVGVVDRNQPQRRRDPFFSGFFDDPFARAATTPVNTTAPPETLTVQPIPEEGRPDDFAGAVGQFEFSVDVRPRELQVGEPLTISLRLQGIGNIAAARPPAYADSDQFRAYEARLVGDNPDASAERGAKTFQQVLFPRTDEVHELPALRFSFFDPEAGRYQSITAGPFPLTVHPSPNGESALVLQLPGRTSAKALILGSDIIYLKSAPSRWRGASDRRSRFWLVLGLHASAPLALAGLFLATRRRERLARDVAFARRQAAPRITRAHIRQAEAALRSQSDPSAIFTPLAAGVAAYFGHRLNLPPGAVDAALVLEKLGNAKADPSDLETWQKFFSLADQVRFASAPAVSREELSNWIPTVAALLRKVERSRL